jgi:hypothetical protein
MLLYVFKLVLFYHDNKLSLCGGFVELEDENLEMKSEDNYIWIKAEDEYFFSINSKLYSSSHVKVNLTPKLPNIYNFSR